MGEAMTDRSLEAWEAAVLLASCDFRAARKRWLEATPDHPSHWDALTATRERLLEVILSDAYPDSRNEPESSES